MVLWSVKVLLPFSNILTTRITVARSPHPLCVTVIKVLPIQPIHIKNYANGLDWQGCLTGSSKTAPRIFIFSIALGADYSLELDFIIGYAPAFSSYNK